MVFVSVVNLVFFLAYEKSKSGSKKYSCQSRARGCERSGPRSLRVSVLLSVVSKQKDLFAVRSLVNQSLAEID
jgi:hypothetical protein